MLQKPVVQKAIATIPEGSNRLSDHLSSYVLWTHAQYRVCELDQSKNHYAYADAKSGTNWLYGKLGYEDDIAHPQYYFVENSSGEKYRLTTENVKSGEVIVRTLTEEEALKLA